LDKLGIAHWNTHPEEGWVDSKNTTDSKDLIVRVKRINSKYQECKE
jgi:3-oxoacyl-ACP reductase-like protein